MSACQSRGVATCAVGGALRDLRFPAPTPRRRALTASISGAAPRCARALVILLLCLVTLVPVRGALAQGTSGQLPDPISSQDLQVYLNRYIHPSPEQWAPIEQFHDQYKAAFAQLREGDIERFLQDGRAFNGTMPSKKQIEEFMQRMDRLYGRIRTLDNQLFDQIQTVLGEQQVAEMPRVRLARQRTIYTGSMLSRGLSGAGEIVDFSAEIPALELDPETAARVDVAIRQYEDKLTRAGQKLHDATLRMFTDLVGALEAAGFGNMTQEDFVEDPERVEQMMEVMKEAYAQVGRRTSEAASEIVSLNRRELRSLMSMLPGDQARQLRMAFIRKAYPQLAMYGQGTEDSLRHAIRSESISDDQRAALQAMLTSFLAADDALVDRLMDAQDEAHRSRSPFDFNPEDMEELESRLTALGEDRQRLAAETVAQAQALLGMELAQRLAQEAIEGQRAEIAPVNADDDGGESAQAWHDPNTGPRPVGVREIGQWASRLKLDAGQKAILETLHRDYLVRRSRELDPLIVEMHQAQATLYRTNDDGTFAGGGDADLEAVRAKRRAVRTLAEQIDAELLANMRSSFGDGDRARAMRVIELQRLMSASLPGDTPGYFPSFNESKLAEVDPFAVIDGALKGSEAEIAEMIVLDHADELVEVSRSLAAATDESVRIQESLSLRQMRAQGDSQTFDWQEWQEMMRKAGERIAEPRRKRSELIQTIVDTVKSAMGPESTAAIDRAFQRQCYPSIFSDPRAAEPFIEKALQLKDLTPDQRAQIETLSKEYTPAWFDLCQKMSALTIDQNPMTSGDPNAWKEWQAKREQRDRLQFDRDELSIRAVRRLSMILTDEQRAQLRGLDEYLKAPAGRSDPF